MNLQTSEHSREMIESLQDWWSLAGVDLDYSNDLRALLKEQDVRPKTVELIPATEKKPAVQTKQSAESVATIAPSTDFPDSYETFVEWLSKPENLLEQSWARNFAMPTGKPEPEIMVITAMPEQTNSEGVDVFNARSQQLFKNMMAAIGCDSEKLYLSSLALARSIDGRIAPDDQIHLKDRMMHLIGLVKPERIIVFGDGASTALLGKNLLAARQNKHFINHVSSTTEAIATFHPRMLLDRPEFKAEAWKDLQLLTRISAS